MPAHSARLFCRKPLLAAIVVVAHELFLFRVDRNHWPAGRLISLHCAIDMPELSITIRMIVSLLDTAIALQTVVLIMQNLRYFGVTDVMMASGQRVRDRT